LNAEVTFYIRIRCLHVGGFYKSITSKQETSVLEKKLMKESEIRPAKIIKEFYRLSALDAKSYFPIDSRFSIPCPACSDPSFSPAFCKIGFEFVLCDKCSTLYLSPRPPAEEYELFYKESPSCHYWANTFFSSIIETRRHKIFKPKVKRVEDFCDSKGITPKSIMEVGAGHGIFLEEWRKDHPTVNALAIEPSSYLAEVCRSKDIIVLETVAEQAAEWAGRADILICFEVMEHAHDPLKFLQSLYNLITKGGWVVISGLGVEGFDIQVLWEKSKSIFAPQHINFISIKGFETLFAKAGFESVEVSTPGELDVDTVLNALQEDSSLEMGRFERLLLGREEGVLKEFQKFLATQKLSSHCWISARKPL